ncbi:MAG: 2TM domain-containing protein [Promethearchaeota archaeon]
MSEERFNGFSKESLRLIALRKVNFRLSVKIHAGVYVAVCCLLILINWFFTPSLWWVFYPIFGWLIGLVEHYTSYIVYARGIYPMAKRAVIFHLVAYLFVNFYLFIINVLTDPTLWWVIIPAIFWGTGLIIHILTYFVYHRGVIEEKEGMKSRKERAVEKELEKMQKRLKNK